MLAVLPWALALQWRVAAGGDAGSSSGACDALLADYVPHVAARASDEASAEVQAVMRAMSLDEASACADAAAKLSTRHPVGVAHLTEQVARHPDCAIELITKGEAQTRCAQKMYKIAINSLAVAGQMDAARSMWERAISFHPAEAPSARIGWTSPVETPTVWISSLPSQQLWDCSAWSFVRTLEEAAPEILEEVLQISEHFKTAYPYLTRGGTWQDMFLYRGEVWNETLCAMMPTTCGLLLPELPTKPGVPRTTVYNEEIVIFRSEPGASVGAHCGSSNAVVNLHVTLTGGRGTSLKLPSHTAALSDGKAVCFQDSFFHAVEHQGDGEAERISLVVRVMHPHLSRDAFGSATKTDVVDLQTWDESAALRAEVERLRQAYRQLVREPRQRKAETTIQHHSLAAGACPG